MYKDQGPNYYTDTNGVAMPEAQAKEKIKSQHTRNCRKQGRAAAKKNCRDNHRSQIKHHQVGRFKFTMHQSAQQGGKRNQSKTKQVAVNGAMRLPVDWNDGCI